MNENKTENNFYIKCICKMFVCSRFKHSLKRRAISLQ